MADPRSVLPGEGQTNYGSDVSGVQGALAVQSNRVGRPSIDLRDSYSAAGVRKTWAYWTSSTGVLRVKEAGNTPLNDIITNELTDGVAVGGQS